MQIAEAFATDVDPASTMANPTHIHITSAPQNRNEKLLRAKANSASRAASAGPGTNASSMDRNTMPVPAATVRRRSAARPIASDTLRETVATAGNVRPAVTSERGRRTLGRLPVSGHRHDVRAMSGCTRSSLGHTTPAWLLLGCPRNSRSTPKRRGAHPIMARTKTRRDRHQNAANSVISRLKGTVSPEVAGSSSSSA